MEKGVVSMFCLLCLAATTIALDDVTAATISYSMKPYHSSHDHLYDRMIGGSASLQSHDFVLKEDKGYVEKPEFTSSSDSMDADDTRDVEALLSFKNALTPDPDRSLLNWTAENSHNVCSWNGIFCRKRTKRVIAVILPGLGLRGRISPSLGNLSLLRTLNLSQNNLTGRIPPLEVCQCVQLEVLDLSKNKLTGSIPPSLGNCKSMRNLLLQQNSLSGKLPPTLSKCTALQRLKVSENKLSGNLEIRFPISMEVLSAYANIFSGTLPASLAQCTQLQLLDLSKNKLTGQLPNYLVTFSKLRVLSVGYNKLNGGIPSNITNLVKLQVLDLSNNRINGSIPSNLERLEGFKTLGSSKLSSNTLYEDIEIVIKGFEYTITYVLATNIILDLSSNNLIGEIPQSIGNLTSLRLLNLSSNQLEGKIPASLGDISNLEQLDLAKNDLSGEIPQNLSMLSMLAYLDVSFNRLCGSIPLGTQLDTFNATSFQGNKCLYGLPLQAYKEKEKQAQKSTGGGASQGWLSHLDKYVSLNAVRLGVGIGFWGVFSVMIFCKKFRDWVVPPTAKPFYGLYKFPK